MSTYNYIIQLLWKALLFSSISSVTDIMGTIISFLLIEKVGRKPLLLTAIWGLGINNLLYSICGYLGYYEPH